MESTLFIKLKTSLATLVLVMFLLTVTSVVVSATREHEPAGGQSLTNYNNNYNGAKGFPRGQTAGEIDGLNDGYQDCFHGKDAGIDTSIMFGYHDTSVTNQSSASYAGRVDGYNDGFDSGYKNKYDEGYQNCINAGNQNKGW